MPQCLTRLLRCGLVLVTAGCGQSSREADGGSESDADAKGDGGKDDAATSKLAVSTETIDFGAVRLGEITSSGFEVQNLGDAPLTIKTIEISEEKGTLFQDRIAFSVKLPSAIAIPQLESVDFSVQFTLWDVAPRNATLSIDSDDPSGKAARISLLSGMDGEPQLYGKVADIDTTVPECDSPDKTPFTVSLAHPGLGSSVSETITFYNGGSGNRPLVLLTRDAIELADESDGFGLGSDEWDLKICLDENCETEVALGDFPMLLRPADEGNPDKYPADPVYARILFTPESEFPDTETPPHLLVETGFGDNRAQSCVSLEVDCGAPTTCDALGASCGAPSDGCGGTLDCGSCALPETCGGGGVDYHCGCTPISCESQGTNCGSVSDGCGGTFDCGSCGELEVCGWGTPNVCGVVPPDPTVSAPAPNLTVPFNFAQAHTFLYQGEDAIQRGVETNAIDEQHMALVRGRVLDTSGNAISGVKIAIQDRPEYGFTYSRADGLLDIVVNGGATLIVRLEKTGYPRVYRKVSPGWHDTVWTLDTVMTAYDSGSTTIYSSNGSMQVAQSSSDVTDNDGTRRPTLLFPSGTVATMVNADDTEEELEVINVRLTEVTRGPRGPYAMPAELPPSSAYTHAVVLTADEGLEVDAKSIRFNHDVSYYVENYLGFSVGDVVPLGVYDEQAGSWTPAEDGRVIKIKREFGGVAALDVDGSNTAASDSDLAELGITLEEQRALASLYDEGAQLWRARIKHFSLCDINPPFTPLWAPRTPNEWMGECIGYECHPHPEWTCEMENASTIDCQSEILSEQVAVAGAPFSLNYTSERVPGRVYQYEIPLTGHRVPPALKNVELEIYVAGRRFSYDENSGSAFSGAPNQTFIFTWDGKDAYGRPVQGTVPAVIRLGYVYSALYALISAVQRLTDGYTWNSFAQIASPNWVSSIANRDVLESVAWRRYPVMLGGMNSCQLGFGCFTPDIWHVYEPMTHQLFLGDGTTREVEGADRILRTTLGTGAASADCAEDSASLSAPRDIVVDASGNRFVSEVECSRVRKFEPNGTTSTVLSGGDYSGISLDRNGNLYVADSSTHQILRVKPDGSYAAVAGNGVPGSDGDGGAATSASLNDPRDVAVDDEGALYIADVGNARVRRVGSDGVITTYVGGGVELFNEDESLHALDVQLSGPTAVAIKSDGTLYVADDGIVEVTWNGSATKIVESGVFTDIADVEVGSNGEVYVVDKTQDAVFTLIDDSSETDSLAYKVPLVPLLLAGGTKDQETGPASVIRLVNPLGLTVDPEGNVLIAEEGAHRIREILPISHELSTTGTYLIASRDGSEVYEFGASGRHERTLHALTSEPLYQFEYDPDGYLIAVTDFSVTNTTRRQTTIERDDEGQPTAIVSAYGQRTELHINDEGHLETFSSPIIDPTAETPVQYVVSFDYSADGLMRTETDENNHVHSFDYYANGLLMSDGLLLSDDPEAEDAVWATFDLASSTEAAVGISVRASTLESPLERDTTYREQRGLNLERSLEIEHPDGTTAHAVGLRDRETTLTYADGTETFVAKRPDPRFGMNAPLISATQTTPSGLQAVVSTDRDIALSDPDNVMSLASQTDRITVNDKIWTSTFTVADRTGHVSTPEEREVSYTVDEHERLLSVTLPCLVDGTCFEDVEFTYRATGITVTQGARIWTAEYDSNGYVGSETDPLMQTTTFDNDTIGRVKKETRSDLQSTYFNYDGRDNLLSLTPPARPTATFTYTPADLPESYTLSRGESEIDAWDLDRDIASSTDNTSTVLTYNRETTTGNLQSIVATVPDHVPTTLASFDYYPATATSGAGKLKSITDRRGTIPQTLSYTYDGLLNTVTTWSGTVNGSIEREFNSNFAVSGLTLSTELDEKTVDYVFDDDGLVTQAGDLIVIRDPQAGLFLGTSLGSLGDAYTYNAYGELESTVTADTDSEIFAEDGITYYANGQMATRTERVAGIGHTYAYAYYSTGWLKTVSKDSAPAYAYTYDANGNRKSVSTPLDGTTTCSIEGDDTVITTDDSDRLLSCGGRTYYYDAKGRVEEKHIGASVTIYQYDLLDKLVGVTLPDETQIDYVLDGAHRRIGKKVNGVLTQGFLYDGSRIVAELDSDDRLVRTFVYGTRGHVPDYMETSDGQLYKLVLDHLGSVRAVVNVSSGDIEQQLDYGPFGEIATDTNPGWQPFGFAGGLYDADTGLVHFGAREYDPERGQWNTLDPIQYGDGTNLYSYVENDPLNFVDPAGTSIAVPFPNLAPGIIMGVGLLALSPFLFPGSYKDRYISLCRVADAVDDIFFGPITFSPHTKRNGKNKGGHPPMASRPGGGRKIEKAKQLPKSKKPPNHDPNDPNATPGDNWDKSDWKRWGEVGGGN